MHTELSSYSVFNTPTPLLLRRYTVNYINHSQCFTTVIFIPIIAARFRFMGSGVPVSVVNIATSENGVEHRLEFSASPDAPLPIVEGQANTPLPSGCSMSSLEFNTYSGWVINSFDGFSLAERDSRVYLEVYKILYQ